MTESTNATPTSELATRRLANLTRATERFAIDTSPDTTGGEDLAPYLAGEEPCGIWCAITTGREITYAYPTFADAAAASGRACEDILDDIYAEYPVAVVNLDTGEIRRASYQVTFPATGQQL
jgi:hypothetical protein